MTVRWTDRAKARLRAIEQHIAKDSSQAAKAEIEKILRRSLQLAELPKTGHTVPGYDVAGLREVLIRPYRLIYRIQGNQIDVITVLHYRQLLPGDLAKLNN
jgi:toxin ParE1/3/4